MKITEALPLENYKLSLRFDDGVSGVVDLSSFAGRGVFASWLQEGVFEQVKITGTGAVEWPGEIDLCADALYLLLTGRSPEDLFPTLSNQSAHA